MAMEGARNCMGSSLPDHGDHICALGYVQGKGCCSIRCSIAPNM